MKFQVSTPLKLVKWPRMKRVFFVHKCEISHVERFFFCGCPRVGLITLETISDQRIAHSSETQNTALTRIIITTTNYTGKVLGYRSSLAIVFVVFISYHAEITTRPLKPVPLQQTPVCAFSIPTLCFHRKPHVFLSLPQLISAYFRASPRQRYAQPR